MRPCANQTLAQFWLATEPVESSQRQNGFGENRCLRLSDFARAVNEVKEVTGGAGCARVIEATGLQAPLDLASEICRERGRLIIAGYHQDGPQLVNMQSWNWRGLDIINAHERDPNIYLQGMREAVNAIAQSRLNPAPLYTHRFELGEIATAQPRHRDLGQPAGDVARFRP